MLSSSSALKPKDIGQIRLMPLLILAEEAQVKREAEAFIKAEFDDYLYLIDYENLEGYKDLESLEEINVHIIKIYEAKAELFFGRNKIEREFDDLEELLDEFGRELIAYYRRVMR